MPRRLGRAQARQGGFGVWGQLLDRVRRSCSDCQQPWQADQIVGGHGEGELPVDFWQPAMARLAQPGDRFGPAKRFLDALADAQANRVTGVPRGAAINRRAPAVVVLRDMRGDVDLAHLGDEVLGVEAFVAAERDALRGVGMRFDQMLRGKPFGVSRGAVATAPTISPLRFSIRAWPMKQSFASLPRPLR